ncbi:MAG TPA: GDP-mannose 4,6-dehydratase [Stellaceae bacterium]|nr:GDP-mannose 4,6-dehydratase [Stellaceae bacterium]
MATSKTALIIGISGQDGSYLAASLIAKGYTVHGTSRDKELANFANLKTLGIYERVTLHSATVTDFRSVVQVIRETQPNEIYNLAAQSSVGLSFTQPVETLDSVIFGTVNLLEAMRFLGEDIRYYSASSSECFGVTPPGGAVETTAFVPRSPYSIAKASAHWIVANYREAYGLHACSGLLFNHESPLRPARYVTQKIVRGAVAIARHRQATLALGNLDVTRDWGWAPEFVEAMWLMLQLPQPQDLVIATGKPASLRDFTARAFARLDLDWQKYVVSDEAFLRPVELDFSCGNASRARERLGWTATVHWDEVVDRLVDAELARQERQDR